MSQRIKASLRLEGSLSLPGDKSISHRALIFNAMAQGKATIVNLSPGLDCQSTIRCLQGLGVQIQCGWGEAHDQVIVTGRGRSGFTEPEDVLDAGNSGTTVRLLTGLLAAQPFLSVLTGDDSLRRRPMGRIIKPLTLMGAHIWGRGGDTLAPLCIKGGPLQGIEYVLPVASAQLKSAILIAGLYAQGETVVVEPAPCRDHTERMLLAMGASITTEGQCIILTPGEDELHCVDVVVPGDISAAAFWLVAGAINPQAHITIHNVGINPTRAGVIQVLQAMGANLRVLNPRMVSGEPVADLEVASSQLRGVEIGGEIIPRLIDELPVLAVAAALAQGTTVIRDAAEMRVKESDRIATTVEGLARLGAHIRATADGMIVHGVSHLTGATCDSYGDHRLAMALAVAGLVARGETTVLQAEAADVSYPGFWSDLESLC